MLSPRSGRAIDGAVLGTRVLPLRFADARDDRLLLVNLGRDLDSTPAAGAAAGAAGGARWRVLWSSEDPRYGGGGIRAGVEAHATGGGVLGHARPGRGRCWSGRRAEAHDERAKGRASPVLASADGRRQAAGHAREWLVTNGLGGYASGTVAGSHTRRYHGLLIAALPAPLGTVMLNHLSERLPAGRARPCPARRRGARRRRTAPRGRLPGGVPARAGPAGLAYEVDGVAIEKRVLLPHGQNTVHVTYRLSSGGGPCG